jgi:hypothetical protein
LVLALFGVEASFEDFLGALTFFCVRVFVGATFPREALFGVDFFLPFLLVAIRAV